MAPTWDLIIMLPATQVFITIPGIGITTGTGHPGISALTGAGVGDILTIIPITIIGTVITPVTGMVTGTDIMLQTIMAIRIMVITMAREQPEAAQTVLTADRMEIML